MLLARTARIKTAGCFIYIVFGLAALALERHRIAGRVEPLFFVCFCVRPSLLTISLVARLRNIKRFEIYCVDSRRQVCSIRHGHESF